MNICVLVSGNGTNLQALINAETAGEFGKAGNTGKLAAVISDRAGVYALERAKTAGIPVFVEEPDFKLPKDARRTDLSNRILRVCQKKEIDLIVFAGFTSIIKDGIIDAYAGKMINVHPSLLPKFGGQGMYGHHVHSAVLAAGETESGCTVHIVNAETDSGPILLQRKVPVLPGDTPESLAERIHKEEHIALAEAVKMMLEVK